MSASSKKRQPGRPNTGRTEYLEVRMTPEEKERIAAAAEREGLSVSDFVRLTMRKVTGEATFALHAAPNWPTGQLPPIVRPKKEK